HGCCHIPHRSYSVLRGHRHFCSDSPVRPSPGTGLGSRRRTIWLCNPADRNCTAWLPWTSLLHRDDGRSGRHRRGHLCFCCSSVVYARGIVLVTGLARPLLVLPVDPLRRMAHSSSPP